MALTLWLFSLGLAYRYDSLQLAFITISIIIIFIAYSWGILSLQNTIIVCKIQFCYILVGFVGIVSEFELVYDLR